MKDITSATPKHLVKALKDMILVEGPYSWSKIKFQIQSPNMKAENNVAHTYRCTHHDIGEEHDNHILVFRVKSKGAFWPSKQNLSKLATV